MIISSKTPFRVSLFGGGTDFEEFFKSHGGLIIGGSINRFNHITLSKPLIKNEFILDFAKIHKYTNYQKIWHPVIKKSIELFNIDSLKISYSTDMPARSGIGSSSSFIIGYLNALNTYLKYNKFTNKNLILEAYNFEKEILNESVGIQDHILCGSGGFKIIKFYKGKKIKYETISNKANDKKIKFLNDNLILVSTDKYRSAATIEKNKIENIENKISYYKDILNLTKKALNYFQNEKLHDFLLLLNDYWEIKKNLTYNVSNSSIDKLIDLGIKNGAKSAKIIGAGGGGYILFYCPVENQKEFFLSMKKKNVLSNFNFSNQGTRLFY